MAVSSDHAEATEAGRDAAGREKTGRLGTREPTRLLRGSLVAGCPVFFAAATPPLGRRKWQCDAKFSSA
jgi:hypothetical protein